MRYLITTPEHPPFFAAYFDPENHFAPGMTVYDLHEKKFTSDGVMWCAIAPGLGLVARHRETSKLLCDPYGKPIEFESDFAANQFIESYLGLSSDEREAMFSLEQIKSEQ